MVAQAGASRRREPCFTTVFTTVFTTRLEQAGEESLAMARDRLILSRTPRSPG